MSTGEGLQQAVLLSLGLQDKEGFARHVAQLKPLYSTEELCQAGDAKSLVVGLQLMFLLVENRLAEFHSELELLTEAERQIEAIAFPIKLEQFMMVGSFNQVLAATESVPSATFNFFMGSIVKTVRDSIAECAQAAYASLSLDAAQKMLMLDSRDELFDFVASQAWTVEGQTIIFQLNDIARSTDVPSMRLLSESLAYATELERIV
jgi:26S proteasome regulatory subunit N12